jgi:hypothetical protein
MDDPTVSLLKGKKNQHSTASVSNSVSSSPFPFPFHQSFSKSLESFSEFVNNTHRQVVEAMEIRRKVKEIKMFPTAILLISCNYLIIIALETLLPQTL